MPELSILLADDDAEDLELMEAALCSVEPEIKVHKVSNGKEVVDYLSSLQNKNLPSLIILDYNMHELTGSEVLSIINKDNRYISIPKIILSTSNNPVYKQYSLIDGATEYFVKPDNIDDLNKLAKKMLSYCNPT